MLGGLLGKLFIALRRQTKCHFHLDWCGRQGRGCRPAGEGLSRTVCLAERFGVSLQQRFGGRLQCIP